MRAAKLAPDAVLLPVDFDEYRKRVGLSQRIRLLGVRVGALSRAGDAHAHATSAGELFDPPPGDTARS